MKNDFTFSYTLTEKEKQSSYKSIVIWFFGLSGSGKSTLCNSIEQSLFQNNIKTVVLDGDSLRNGLNKDLDFSKEDRIENLRRVSEISKILNKSGLLTLCSFITPFEKNRSLINSIIGRENIFWIFVDTPIEECIKRDTKGLYKKAIKGEIKNFTGISSPFETPQYFDFRVENNINIDDSTRKITSIILNKIKIK
jgi:adenylylsulfate kinase